MTIQEQLEQLNNRLGKLYNDLVGLNAEKKKLDERYDSVEAAVKTKYQQEQEALIQEKEEVLKYYRIAKDNSVKELLSDGVNPQKPDLGRLNNMIEKINSYNRTDPVADQLIDLCSCYNVYIKQQIETVKSTENAEIQKSERARTEESQSLAQKRIRVISECARELKCEVLKRLAAQYGVLRQEHEITESFFRNWNQKKKKSVLLGYGQYRINAPKNFCPLIKESLKEYFLEDAKSASLPYAFSTNRHQKILIEYTDQNEAELKQGIQALILNFLRCFSPTEFKISVLDYIYYNADVLGPLYVFSSGKNGWAPPVPCDDRMMKSTLALLENSYKRIGEKLGAQSVYEYNRTHKPEEQIPYRILVINREKESFSTKNTPEIAYLVNNAEKYGITLIQMEKQIRKEEKTEKQKPPLPQKISDCVRIISDAQGAFMLENHGEWMPFQWLRSSASLPNTFVKKVKNMSKIEEVGTEYFKRYQPKLPVRSNGKRRPIFVPFAVDNEDKPVDCSFENELFAAYMMGASRSGKSTLLHTIISGLLMNYHPDELELWLLDFKMVEFKKYERHRPPHVKYLLLEKSEDLVFDIIDQLENVLLEREYTFSKNGWQKQSEVPVDIYMPVIFVIIDEFAQMSQIIKETKGSGYGADYALKLANLLQKGAALGIKFLFASQTYSEGVEGLTEPAKKQIQQRFALKNTYQEIKDTLELSSEAITPAIQNDMNSLPPFESIFKWRTEDGQLRVDRVRNMYTKENEVERLVDYIAKNMTTTRDWTSRKDSTYLAKQPIFIDGAEPKSFKSQIPYYQAYETPEVLDELEADDVLIYPGVPCSFNLARPFPLVHGTGENVLIVGGKRENELSVALSVFCSYSRKRYPVEIWANGRNSIYRRYGSNVLGKYKTLTRLEDICDAIQEIKEAIRKRQYDNRMIAVFGYEAIANDLELLGEDAGQTEKPAAAPAEASEDDMAQVLEKIYACDDPAEQKRLLDEYNESVAAYDAKRESAMAADKGGVIYDARGDMEWIIKRASAYGIHFVFCFERGKDFLDTKLDNKAFRHKIAFSMSREESSDIIGSRKANEIEEGGCLYSNGKDFFAMHPHLYYGVPCNGWQMDDQGNIVLRRA